MREYILPDDFDLNRPSEEITMDLFYQTNGFRVPLSRIRFNDVVANDLRPDIDYDANTQISACIDTSYDMRFRGESVFFYRRLSLSKLFRKEGRLVIGTDKERFKISEVLESINYFLRSQLTMEDLLEEDFCATCTEITLRANPKSLVWMGEITIEVITTYVPPLVTVTDLTGFYPYQEEAVHV